MEFICTEQKVIKEQLWKHDIVIFLRIIQILQILQIQILQIQQRDVRSFCPDLCTGSFQLFPLRGGMLSDLHFLSYQDVSQLHAALAQNRTNEK